MKPQLQITWCRRACKRLGQVSARQDGFTLTEAVASILVVMLFMAASAATLISGYRALRQTKFVQQATALGNRGIEEARDVPYNQLGMLNSDLAGDPEVLSTCGTLGAGSFYDPGPNLDCERIVSADGNVDITDHVQTVTVEGKDFTVRRYVTWVDEDNQGGPDQDYKRLSVVVEWNNTGTDYTFDTSTFVARARRGLPAPKFRLSPPTQTKQVEPGQTVAFAHSVANLGITDAYDIAMSVPAGWGVAFYKDQGTIGVYEPLVDTTTLTDTNGTGTIDTGNVLTSQTTYFLAVVTVPVSAATATVTLTLSATSGANPDPDLVQNSQDRAQVGPVGLLLYLHNRPTPPTADTAAQANTDMNITQPTATNLYQYSTDWTGGSPQTGRQLDPQAAADNQSSTRYMANWVYQVPATATFTGTGSVRLWVAARNSVCDKPLTLRLYVRQKNGATQTNGSILAQVDHTIPAPGGAGPCEFAQVDIPFTMNATVAANRWIELKVEATNTSSPPVRLAYDTTAYPSRIVLPQVVTP